MNDNYEFTLHSPLTKEDWNKISDAEHEHTKYVTFQTPQGRQVKYIKCDVLEKIKGYVDHIRNTGMGKKKSLDLIEKFIEGLKAESEE